MLEKLRAAIVAQLPPFNAETVPGFVPNLLTGRIANRFDLRGPNYFIDAACASSLVAVQSAMDELRSGRSDLMLAGASTVHSRDFQHDIQPIGRSVPKLKRSTI